MWINHCRGPLLHTEAFIHKIWKLQASSIKIYLHIKLPFAYCQLLNHPYEPQNLLEILGQHRHSNATQVFQIFCYSFSISRLAGVSLLSNSLYRDHTLSQLRRRLVSRSLQTSGNNATTVWCFPTQIITDIRNVTSSPFLVIAKVNLVFTVPCQCGSAEDVSCWNAARTDVAPRLEQVSCHLRMSKPLHHDPPLHSRPTQTINEQLLIVT